MLRVIGAIFVVVGCSYGGFMQANQLKQQVNITKEFIQTLAFMEREISQTHRLLPDIIKAVAENPSTQVGLFFRQLEHRLDGDDSFFQQWVQTFQEEPDLAPQLQQVLQPLGGVLGQYDSETQQSVLEKMIEQLEHLRRVQEEESIRLGRVYCVMGMALGLLLAILWI